MLLGPAAIIILLWGAFNNINPAGKGDINKPLPWIIIIAIFTPIAIGLTIFGWYAWKGEYREATSISQGESDQAHGLD